jgi:hypothetical protein
MTMREPTNEELDEYERRLEAIIAARNSGKDTESMRRELTRFMQRTGIAEQGSPEAFDGDCGSEPG